MEIQVEELSPVQKKVSFVVDSERTVKSDSKSRDALQIRQLRSRLPRDGSLGHLLRDVLQLDGWDGLGPWLQSHAKGASR